MNIHEYQAKKLLSGYGVDVLKGGVAYNAEEAVRVAQEIEGNIWVVKAQIHAGGRGKGKFIEEKAGTGGGVRLAKAIEDVSNNTKQMLGSTLVTHQSGAEGRRVKRVYIEEGCAIKKELYLGMLVDRKSSCITVVASTEGGVEIEKVAAETPEKIIRQEIDAVVGMSSFYARKIAFGLGLKGKQVNYAVKFLTSMYKAFIELDASMIEINPLVVTEDDRLIALDAKMNFDDNSLFRQKEIEELRDEDEEDKREIEASKYGLSYVSLFGNIGCMVNGAGLAMATMDIIKYYGGDPANFLDVGGGATKEKVCEAFKIILSDPKVEAILVNIFGGIMRCNIIAEGVVAAAKEIELKVPLVVRLEGTNVNLGKQILSESGLPIITADNLEDAAKKAVQAVKEKA
ncbi:MAG: ADP-forming succinate--CoA ligase subunit beta [Alphaproteobacteria bacterium]